MPARIILFTIMCLFAGLCNGEEAKPVDQAQLKRWIVELGSDEFETRMAAFAKLKRAGAAAETVLEAGKASQDVEVSARIAELLQPLYARRAKIRDWTELSERVGPIFGADLKVIPPDDAQGPKN